MILQRFMRPEMWLSQTQERLSVRGSTLKALDKAVADLDKAFEDAQESLTWYDMDGKLRAEYAAAIALEDALKREAVARLNSAFATWVHGRVSDWRTSPRNSQGAFTRLLQYLNNYRLANLGGSEEERMREQKAREALVENRNNCIAAVFTDCVVRLKNTDLAERAKTLDTREKRKQVPNALDRAHLAHDVEVLDRKSGINEVIRTVYHDCFGGHAGSGAADADARAVLQYAETLVGTHLKNALRRLYHEIPVVGVVTRSASCIYKVTRLVDSTVARHDLVNLNERLPENDPQKAINAVISWQNGYIAKQSVDLARAGLGLANSIMTVCTMGGHAAVSVATSIVNAIVEIIELLVDLGIQYRSAGKLNDYMTTQAMGPDIFLQCPLAGAYFVLNTPISHVALCFIEIGQPAWQEDVYVLTQHDSLKTLIQTSHQLIENSHYRIYKRNGPQLIGSLDPTLKKRALNAMRDAANFTRKHTVGFSASHGGASVTVKPDDGSDRFQRKLDGFGPEEYAAAHPEQEVSEAGARP